MIYPIFFLCLFTVVGSTFPPILHQVQTIECAGTKFFDTYIQYATYGCDFYGLKKKCCVTQSYREQFKQCATMYYSEKNSACVDQVISTVDHFYDVSRKLVYIMTFRALMISIAAMILGCIFVHFWRRR
uniref:Domain of unknown function DB domain-containing protein n=1 Tax=Panagrellus redivivus TaxID=6233 RepID=A0A7E4VVF7_PANRE